MATPRDIRRLAFQILYQLDARGGEGAGGAAQVDDAQSVLATLTEDEEESAKFTDGERKKAFLLATEAYGDRAAADAFMTEAAPGWPAHRQAAVDRAILRLAHHEMISGKTNPKIVVNEAVELAKAFSTDKSPAFINGLLDKVLKKVMGESAEAVSEAAVEETQKDSSEAASSDAVVGGEATTGESTTGEVEAPS